MSINSKAKRDRKRKLFQLAWQKRQHNEFPHRTCNYSGCRVRSYTFKRCREHRLAGNIRGILAKMAKNGSLLRVRRGVYQKTPEFSQQVFTVLPPCGEEKEKVEHLSEYATKGKS